MAKVEIDFPADFESEVVRGIPLGRLYVGNHHIRFEFSPLGKLRVFIPKSAITSGDVIVYDSSEMGASSK